MLSGVDSWVNKHPLAVDLPIAALLACLLLPPSVTAVVDSTWIEPAKLLCILLFIAGHCATIFRRLWPFRMFLVLAAMSLGLLLAPGLTGEVVTSYGAPLPPIFLPSSLVFVLGLYTLATRASERTSLLALAASGIGLALLAIRLFIDGAFTAAANDDAAGAFPFFLTHFVPIALGATIAPWAVGRVRYFRSNYLRALESQVQLESEKRNAEARELIREEREAIARDMHDIVAHSLSVIVSQAEGGRMMLTKKPHLALPILETVASTGQDAMKSMRELLDVLSPTDNASLTPSLSLSELDGLFQRVRDVGIPVQYQSSGFMDSEKRTRPDSVEYVAYRVLQESMTNIIKHATHANLVNVHVKQEEHALEITVTNDGVRAPENRTRGRGLAGMRQRVESLGGTFDASPRNGNTFVVRAMLPLREVDS